MREAIPGSRIRNTKPERGPAVRIEQVESEVLSVNENFPEIASLSESAVQDFAYFAVDPENPNGSWIDYRPGHNRSFLLSDMNVVDSKGISYGKINIKGSGYISLGENWQGHSVIHSKQRTLSPRPIVPFKNYDGSSAYKGLMSLEDAETDFQNGERLADMGIRTSRGVAILRLKNIPVPGKGMVPVEEIVKNDPSFVPVIYVRAMGTDTRVGDFMDPNLIKRSSADLLRKQKAAALEEAIQVIEEETGRENISLREYVIWFAETLGTNIGRLHKNGYTHDSLTSSRAATFDVLPGNVSLDCRIVDLDSVAPAGSRKWGIEHAQERDVKQSKEILVKLFEMCSKSGTPRTRGALPSFYFSKDGPLFYKELTVRFDAAYKKEMESELVEEGSELGK